MITIPPPKDEPTYTDDEREIMRGLFLKSKLILQSGRFGYICIALTRAIRVSGYDEGTAGAKAHELILRRLGVDTELRVHTYPSWLYSVNAVFPADPYRLRIEWLESLIKEFE